MSEINGREWSQTKFQYSRNYDKAGEKTARCDPESALGAEAKAKQAHHIKNFKQLVSHKQ